MMIKRKLEGAIGFASWAKRQKLELSQWDGQTLARFRKHLAQRGTLRYPSGRYNRADLNARVFVEFLKSRGIVGSSSPCADDDALRLLGKFNDWMRTQRGTLNSTLGSYRPSLIKLLRALGTEPANFTARNLRAYLLQQVACSSSGTWRNMTTALRMFLRFLIVRGDCPAGLDHAIPSVARWNLASLPKYLPAEKVEELINSCDQSQHLGARDRAIFLLMARLGLRASDVGMLKIGDLEWSEGTVLVAGKDRHQTRLPLPQDVGDAILHYIVHARPTAPSDYVFITTVAPLTRITRQGIRSAVVRSLRRTGISAELKGPHLFRHSVATNMLREGVSLPAIGALLRHASVETTAVYAKVDFTSLAEIARPWPEVQPC